MERTILLDHYRKINKALTMVLILLTLFSILGSILTKSMSSISIAITEFSVVTISIYLIYKKKFEKYICYIICFAVSLAAICQISDSRAILSSLIPITMAALYLNTPLILSCSLLMDISLFAALHTNVSFFSDFILFNVITIILFSLTRAGKALLDAAIKETEHASEALNNLTKTMGIIDDNTLGLNEDITSSYENLAAAKEISNAMTTTVQEVVVGVTGQAESIEQIYDMINTTDETAQKTHQISSKLKEISNNTSQLVSSGSVKIKQMNEQMNIIGYAVTDSVSTVHELQNNIREINDFLSSIVHISEQTNLLSLNASIEAARAGEAGKGFTVVAGEIGKLADQSAKTVSQINAIVENIDKKMELVLDTVQKGKDAVKTGEVLVDEVDESFDYIQSSFNDIGGYILTVQQMIENTNNVFGKIRKESESMSSIAEEHSAATEEMLSTMEEQNTNINNIYDFMQKIKESSDNLRGVVQNK